ncbi:MAG: OmpA family protein [Treponema sp.]|nr:OmpA family protein [Treponema sp.]
MSRLKTYLLTIITLLFLHPLFSETFRYTGSKNYIYVERTDLRRYDNAKYAGLMSREVKAYITPTASAKAANNSDNDNDGAFFYSGNFYVNQDIRKGVSYLTEGIHKAIPSSFLMDENGALEMLEDNGYPSFRSFPAFPAKDIEKGQTWEAKAERAVDPLDKNVFTRMPMYIQYTYLRDEVYNGEDVYLLSAKWATRYGAGTKYVDEDGDRELVAASGNHNATICISKANGKVVVVRDTIDETFSYADGNKVNFKGTISLFTEYPPSIDEDKIVPEIAKIDDVDIEKTEAGLLMNLQNLQFKPDSSELLPGENERLSKLADILKKFPNSQFLVEGHTASTGNPKGEMNLSLERAYSIVKELVNRGVSEKQFICKGSGGTKPAADNATPEGRAKNRRVEITILE